MSSGNWVQESKNDAGIEHENVIDVALPERNVNHLASFIYLSVTPETPINFQRAFELDQKLKGKVEEEGR